MIIVRRWLIRLLTLSLGLLGGLIIIEIALRAMDVSYPGFNIVDENRGTALRPGARGWWREEGEAYVQISSAGLRDREHAKTKPPGQFRIAILGDSYAEASQVPVEDAFWAVLEQELKKCSLRDIEVINFGVSGYGTAQELVTLRHQAWDYSPDLVILAFVTGNDVRNNFRGLEKDPMRPYFVYDGGKLVLDASFRKDPGYRKRQSSLAKLGYRVINYSRLLQVTNQAKNLIWARNKQLDQQAVASHLAPGEELGLDSMVYREPNDPLWKEAWRVTEGLILLMRDEIRQKGAQFLVVTLSNGIQVHPEPSVRQTFMNRLGIHSLFYPDLRVKALGEREGFPVLNLAPVFQKYADEHKAFVHGFHSKAGSGHWNSLGHRLAGEAMAQQLCQNSNLQASGQQLLGNASKNLSSFFDS